MEFADRLNERELPRLAEAKQKLEALMAEPELGRLYVLQLPAENSWADFREHLFRLPSRLEQASPTNLRNLDHFIADIFKSFDPILQFVNDQRRSAPERFRPIWDIAHRLEAALLECSPIYFDDNKISEFERNRRVITYRELHAYARLLEIPVGVLLCISRFASNIRDNLFEGEDGLHVTATRLGALCNSLLNAPPTLVIDEVDNLHELFELLLRRFGAADGSLPRILP